MATLPPQSDSSKGGKTKQQKRRDESPQARPDNVSTGCVSVHLPYLTAEADTAEHTRASIPGRYSSS